MKIERMAEPRERPRLKEGYPFPDINSYIVALKNRLHIPEERFQELQRTRGAKLEGWMSAVQPIEDDRPPVRAKIGSRGVLLSSDIKLPGKITENTPVSQVLQTDALYLAKLKYLKEAAPQATSWGRGRTKEKQVKQQITELTSRSIVAGGKIDRISFKEALVSLDNKKMAPALVIATLALAEVSCTGGPKPIEPSPAEPIVTEVAQVPTASPEAISSFNESAQKIVDEVFKDLGVHDINMVGAGILADPEGREYALFTSILPDKNNETDLDFLLIGEVGTDNQVENIKGLVLDEEQQDSVLEIIAVSFNPDTETFVLEGPFIRTNTQTGEIEIFNNGSWRSLEGPERTINDVKQRLGHGVLAAIALPTPTAEAIESTYQLEDGVQLERMEQGQLVELFPGSEVFMSERGDVVIINKETGIQLAGQRIETKYGSYTFLMADSAYQYIIRSILDEKEINLDEEAILSRYPADWLANNEFKQEVLKVVEDLRKIQGFKEGKESLGGYPNLAESPYKEELTRVISTLLALKEREISLGSVNLANYQPKPKDFVMVTMKIGNAQRLADILPEGLIDPNDPASMVIYTGADVGYPVIKTQDNVYLNAYFTSTVGKPLKSSYETVFYHVFTSYFTDFPWRFLVRDAGRVHGINVRFSYSLFWEGPFAPLFSNLDIYGHLTAFSPERSPHKPPYTIDQNWEQQNWVRFGTSEVVEIDFEKFE